MTLHEVMLIANVNPLVYAPINQYLSGVCSYEDALSIAVIALHKENKDLLDIIQRHHGIPT